MCLLSSTIGNHHRCHHHSSHHHTAQRPPHYDIQTLCSPSKSSHTTTLRWSYFKTIQMTWPRCQTVAQIASKTSSGANQGRSPVSTACKWEQDETLVWKSCDNYSKLISSVILFTTFPGPASEQWRSSGSSQSFLFLGGGLSCPYIHGEAIQHKCIESFFME